VFILLRESSVSNQPKREAIQVTASKAIRVRLPKPFGTHIMITYAPNAGYGAKGLNVCPAGFQSCFSLIAPFYVSNSSLLEW
jgi:hypothetical protein